MNPTNKKLVRQEVLAGRDALPEETRSELSLKIKENLFSLPQWPPGRGVLFFATMRSEVDTVPMIKTALEQGAKVALPRMAEPGELEVCWVKDLDEDLAPNSMGIREPKGSCEKASPKDLGIVIVPGAAFDRAGSRIGYGGGYYDRFLSQVPWALRVAVAFDLQFLDSIETSDEDVPVDVLVTESGAKVFYRRLTPDDWPDRATEPKEGDTAGPDGDAGAGPGAAAEAEEAEPGGDSEDAGPADDGGIEGEDSAADEDPEGPDEDADRGVGDGEEAPRADGEADPKDRGKGAQKKTMSKPKPGPGKTVKRKGKKGKKRR